MDILPIATRSDDVAINLALDTLARGKQAIFFVATKRSAEKLAEDIAKHVKLHEHQKAEQPWQALSEEAVHKGTPTQQCLRLSRCLKKGSAFHHAGLYTAQRELIEREFRAGNIPVICATPTLAYGMDLPAYRVVVRDLKRYTAHGMDWIPVLDYQQMCGRAGRPSFEQKGEAICIANSEQEKERIIERFVQGDAEEIYSKLAVEPVLRTYLLSLIATEIISTRSEASAFFAKTFWAHQYEDQKAMDHIMDNMLSLLERCGFIEKEHFATAGEEEKITATLLGKRISELYLDPLTAHLFVEGLERAAGKRAGDFSILQLISFTLEMRPLLSVKQKEAEEIQEQLYAYADELLTVEPNVYDGDYKTFLDAGKTALFLRDWCNELGEDELLKQYDIRPGEIRMKLERADWLLYSLQEIARIQKKQALLSAIGRTRMRVQQGVREELLPLIQLKGIGRVRARKLFNNKIRNVEEIKKADHSTLAFLVGKSIAEDLKKQTGAEVEEAVSPHKRKGQMGLGKWEES
ncbi:hypothetical protein HZB02_04050 [Candidatus Woesearchaeota archaeon]|nr:hypothetical protein [Candidatus Woesearchaeota archaeon]